MPRDNLRERSDLPDPRPIVVPLYERRVKICGPLQCRIWTGATTNGYPVMRSDKKVRQVRRILYEKQRRPLLPGERIVMGCGERLCIRVDHMEAVRRGS